MYVCMYVLDGVVVVEGKGQFWGEFGASHTPIVTNGDLVVRERGAVVR